MRDELLDWFRRLRAISQYGLEYSKDPYDLQRFRQIGALSTEIAARLTVRPAGDVEAALALETGPPTPKLDVRAAVFKGDRILMVRETSDGRWALPGGWVDVGESPSSAAEREVKEESGFDCRATKLIAIVDRDKHAHSTTLLHVYKLFFLCDLIGGEPTTSLETSAVGFFARGALPELSFPRVLPEQVARAFRHREHPELPTEFD